MRRTRVFQTLIRFTMLYCMLKSRFLERAVDRIVSKPQRNRKLTYTFPFTLPSLWRAFFLLITYRFSSIFIFIN